MLLGLSSNCSNSSSNLSSKSSLSGAHYAKKHAARIVQTSQDAPKPRRRRGDLIQGRGPPVEQNPFLEDQTLGTTPSPGYTNFLLKQGELR